MWLLDTNVCIALLHRRSLVVRQRFENVAAADVRLCSVVKAELFAGALKSQRVVPNLAVLDEFFATIESLPFDDASARTFGEVRVALERAGTPIGMADLMIAAIALRHGAGVITANQREFERVPGLRVENWEA